MFIGEIIAVNVDDECVKRKWKYRLWKSQYNYVYGARIFCG